MKKKSKPSKNRNILESAGWEKVGKLWRSPYTRNLQCLRVALEIEKREALTK
jgi:hypothetical protein